MELQQQLASRREQEEEDEAQESQLIQLVNKKLIIKSTNPAETDIELTITDGVLKIIPIIPPSPPAQSSSSSAIDLPALSSSTTATTSEDDKPDSAAGKMEDPKQQQQQSHPLYKDLMVVLENILKYLPRPKDLMAARLICSSWSTALKPYQTVQLTNANLQDFVQHASKTNDDGQLLVPGQFEKYYINRISFNDPENQQDLDSLFQQYGEFMKNLTINLENVECNLAQFRTNILTGCPNLTTLIVRDPTLPFDEKRNLAKFWNQEQLFNNEEFPTRLLPNLTKIKLILDDAIFNRDVAESFITQLLVAAPALAEFTLRTWVEGKNLVAPNNFILSVLSQPSRNLKQLKTLRLPFGLTRADLHTLNHLSQRKVNRLALVKFGFMVRKFNLQDPEPDLEVVIRDNVEAAAIEFGLNQLLRHQQYSLQSLRILADQSFGGSGAALSNYYTVRFPIMTELKSFKFSLSLANPIRIEFDDGGVCFQDNFPKLRKWHYMNTKFDGVANDSDLIIRFKASSPALESVTVLGLDQLDKFDELALLGKLFPNVVNLRIGLEDLHLIQHVWTCGWKLTRLSIKILDPRYPHYGQVSTEYGDGNELDKVITGFPMEYFEGCQTEYRRSNYSNDTFKKLKEDYKWLPGISDLTSLCHFELSSDNNGFGISEFSIYFGLLHPGSFTRLKSLVIGKGQISEGCRTFIRERLGSNAQIRFGVEDEVDVQEQE